MFRTKLIASAVGATALVTLGMSAASASIAASGPSLVPSISGLFAIGCPTTARCVAFGSDQSTNRSNEKSAFISIGTGTAKATSAVLKSYSPGGHVACPTRTTCLTYAFGDTAKSPVGVEVIRVSASTGSMTKTGLLAPPKGKFFSVNSISCQGTTACWLSGWVGEPEGSSTAVLIKISDAGKILKITKVAGYTSVNYVSCESKTTCLVEAYTGPKTQLNKFMPLINGKLGRAHTLSGKDFVQGMSCFTTKLCAAFGGTLPDATAKLLWPLNPKTGVPGKTITINKEFFGDGIDCYDATQCIVAGGAGNSGTPAAVVITKGKPGKMATFSSLDEPFNAVACTSHKVCYAVGQNVIAGTSKVEGYAVRV